MTAYIVPNLSKAKTVATARAAAEILQRHGCGVLLDTEVRAQCAAPGAEYQPVEECLQRADVILTVGGDGTILHEAPLALARQTPILGINVGRCGFLATCEVAEMEEKLALVAAQRFHLDTRALLDVQIMDGTFSRRESALNDVVVYNGRLLRTVDYRILCDQSPVEKFSGDGVIVATPTGSTAYSLSAGGPIVDSQTKAMVLTPICPHSLQASAMVFSPERTLDIEIGEVFSDEVLVSCDGRPGLPLHTGAGIEVTLSEKQISLITFGRADQFEAIDLKLRSRR